MLGLFTLLLFATAPKLAYGQNDRPITICSTSLASSSVGRCTGSAYCSACKNCSRCAHCNSGGSCGVCARRSKSYSIPRQHSSVYSDPSGSNFAPESINQILFIKSQALNLRSGPGTQYTIIGKLTYRQKLTLLAASGEWLKVSVEDSGRVGFVHKNYVKVSN
ncbi:SH3 domain-containing protein [Dawidia cretensis]